jgi:pimeloyl-ACP methyl ester carboxylesterase
MRYKLIILVFIINIFYGCKQQNSTSDNGITEYVNSADGITIAYRVHGEGNIPLLFVHGWCCDKSYWNKQIEYFKKDYFIVAIDLAGHGESDLGRKDYTIQSFANDVSAVIDDLELTNCVMLGHSMGGSVVVETAVQNPDKINAVFLVDSFKEYPESITGESLDSIVNNWTRSYTNDNFKENSYNMIMNWFFPETDSTLQEWIARDMSSAKPEVGISALKNLIIYNYRDLQSSLGRLGNTPMYSINARNDNEVHKFRDNGVNFVESIRIDSVSHFLMMSPADKFNEILKRRLEDL